MCIIFLGNGSLCCILLLKAQPTHPAMAAQPGGMGWPQTQPQMFGMTQPNMPQTMRPVHTPNDPFGSL